MSLHWPSSATPSISEASPTRHSSTPSPPPSGSPGPCSSPPSPLRSQPPSPGAAPPGSRSPGSSNRSPAGSSPLSSSPPSPSHLARPKRAALGSLGGGLSTASGRQPVATLVLTGATQPLLATSKPAATALSHARRRVPQLVAHLRRPARRHALGHRRATARRPVGLVGDLPAQRGPAPARRARPHRPALDRPRLDPRHARRTNADTTKLSADPAPGHDHADETDYLTRPTGRHANDCAEPIDRAPTRDVRTGSARTGPDNQRGPKGRHDRGAGPAAVGLGRRRLVRGGRPLGRRPRAPAPPPRLPLPAARARPGPHPRAVAADAAPPRPPLRCRGRPRGHE